MNFSKAAVLLIIATVFAVYFNALQNDFVWDDNDLIVRNMNLHDPQKNINFIRDFWWITPAEKGSPYFRPVISILYIIDYRLWNLNPFGFHLTNLILMSAASVTLFFLTGVLFKGALIPLSAALIFAVHPVHTENVTWIAGRTDVACGIFYFLSLYFYIKFKKTDKQTFFYSSIAAAFLALLSKESAVTLPFAVILYDWSCREKNLPDALQKNYRNYTFFFSTLPVFYALRYWALEFNNNFVTSATIIDSFAQGHFTAPVMNVLYSIAQYIDLLFLPLNLKIRWKLPDLSYPFSAQGAFAVILSGLFFFSIWRTFRRERKLFFLLTFFLMNILLVSGLITLRDQFSERFLFIPSFSFAAMLPILLKKLFKRRQIWFSVVLIIAILFGYRTYIRNFDWKNDLILKRKEAATNPESAEANMLIGLELYKSGKLDRAKHYLEKAVRLEKNVFDAHLALAPIYYRDGNIEKAIEAYEFCKENGLPHHEWKAALHEGMLFLELGERTKLQGNHEKAVIHFRRAVENFRLLLSTKAYIPQFHVHLAAAYIALEDYPNAEFELNWALKINPDDQKARRMLEDVRKKLMLLR